MEFRRQLVIGHSALLLVTLITAAVAAIALIVRAVGVWQRRIARARGRSPT
jgi:hypothetical protein